MNPRELVTLAVPGTHTELTLAPFRGAIATSLLIRGRELLYMDQSTFLDAAKNVRGGIPVLFPAPGKLEGDRWQRGGRQGAMRQHGFARACAWSLAARDAATAVLTLGSDQDTLVQYPWPFEAILEFALTGSALRVATRVRNTGVEAMPFALGFHPYFLVADKAQASISSAATRAYDNVTRTTGAFHGFDLAAREVDLHLIDHPSDHLSLALGDGMQVVVRAAPEFRRWVVWSLADKPFVCVEPWTAPGNAMNTGEALTVLAPGAEQASWVEIALDLMPGHGRPGEIMRILRA